MSRSYLREGTRSGRALSILLVISLFLCGALASALYFSLRTPSGSSRGAGSAGRRNATSSEGAGGSSAVPVSAPSEEESAGGSGTETGAAGNASLDSEINAGRRDGIVRAAEKAGPSVVTVGVTQTRLVRSSSTVDPFDLFFNRYLPGALYKQKVSGMGSGFVVDPSGIILTNEHVVRGASEIQVILSDGRTLDARLLGADPNYDLAVLKVGGTKLPCADLATTDDLMVGEWAIAIGSPFGFFLNDHQPTVTVGVISAIHRDVKGDEESQAIYKDMIQTDAAINPGNSGGPLVNSVGQVIGINTFIFTQGGGSLGIGFAIPIQTAVRVSREIIKYGRTRPIWIGIYVQSISPWVATQLGLRDSQGLLVSRIEGGSPADRAGVRELDVIRAVDGKTVSNAEEASRTIFGAQVGDVLTFTVERKGQTLTIPVKIEAVPSGQ